VLEDLILEVDSRPVRLTLTRVEIPSRNELSAGLGTIQIRAAGDVQDTVAGHHRLYFRNNHRPSASLYLVNPLIPEDAGVSVMTQTRDAGQQTIRVEYDVRSRRAVQLFWLFVAAVALIPVRTCLARQSLHQRQPLANTYRRTGETETR